ncbi:MAG TPA: MarR family transcriptional regulator, partial [Candidatus Limnocylindrales bacterium]|nr:MarR family transcriptional regulator [Candidatus Limnocylindrales bacterium]
ADAEVVDALERIVFGAVGVTAVALQEATPAIDLTLLQWRVLVVLGEPAGPLRVGILALRIGASVPSASRLVRRMERRGLVETARDEADRRATRVGLSPAGRRVHDELIRYRRSLLARLVADRMEPLPADLPTGLAALAKAFEAYT